MKIQYSASTQCYRLVELLEPGLHTSFSVAMLVGSENA